MVLMKVLMKKANNDYEEPIKKIIHGGNLLKIRDFTDEEYANYNKRNTLGSDRPKLPKSMFLSLLTQTEHLRIAEYTTNGGENKTSLFEVTTNYFGKVKGVKKIDDMAKYQ